MIMKVYKWRGDDRQVGKNVNAYYTGINFNIDIVDRTSMLDLVIRVNDQGYIRNQYNYFEIPDLDRYFFKTSEELDVAGQIILHLKCDVLNVYQVGIKNSVTMIERCGSGKIDKYIKDNSLPLSTKRHMVIKKLSGGTPFSSTLKNYLVVTGGGVDD